MARTVLVIITGRVVGAPLVVETTLVNLVFEVPKEGDVASSSFRLR